RLLHPGLYSRRLAAVAQEGQLPGCAPPHPGKRAVSRRDDDPQRPRREFGVRPQVPLDARLAHRMKAASIRVFRCTSPVPIKIVAAQLALPTMNHRREFRPGGRPHELWANTDESFHVMGEYTGRILKGEKPSNLPIQQLTKFELVITLKTAKT